MHSRSTAIVAAARRCVGTDFRPQGRAVGVGLDCVGVALIAAQAAGVCSAAPPLYTLGGDNHDRLDAGLVALGCTAVDTAMPGDLLVVAPAAGARHVAVCTDAGLIHAHAGLGRVVEAPADPAWAMIAAWRLPEQN